MPPHLPGPAAAAARHRHPPLGPAAHPEGDGGDPLWRGAAQG